jgi:hypothetical protein
MSRVCEITVGDDRFSERSKRLTIAFEHIASVESQLDRYDKVASGITSLFSSSIRGMTLASS